MSLYSILFCHVALDLCSQYIRDQLSACATCDGRRYTHSYQFSSTVLDAGSSTVHGFQNAQSRLHSSSGFLHASDTKRRGLQPMLLLRRIHTALLAATACIRDFVECHLSTPPGSMESPANRDRQLRWLASGAVAPKTLQRSPSKPTLYMRWSSASERPSTQAGATTPLPWKAIVIAIGL